MQPQTSDWLNLKAAVVVVVKNVIYPLTRAVMKMCRWRRMERFTWRLTMIAIIETAACDLKVAEEV